MFSFLQFANIVVLLWAVLSVVLTVFQIIENDKEIRET